jgi:hypothetical protein
MEGVVGFFDWGGPASPFRREKTAVGETWSSTRRPYGRATVAESPEYTRQESEFGESTVKIR